MDQIIDIFEPLPTSPQAISNIRERLVIMYQMSACSVEGRNRKGETATAFYEEQGLEMSMNSIFSFASVPLRANNIFDYQ